MYIILDRIGLFNKKMFKCLFVPSMPTLEYIPGRQKTFPTKNTRAQKIPYELRHCTPFIYVPLLLLFFCCAYWSLPDAGNLWCLGLVVFDPTYETIDMDSLTHYDWTEGGGV